MVLEVLTSLAKMPAKTHAFTIHSNNSSASKVVYDVMNTHVDINKWKSIGFLRVIVRVLSAQSKYKNLFSIRSISLYVCLFLYRIQTNNLEDAVVEYQYWNTPNMYSARISCLSHIPYAISFFLCLHYTVR